MALELKILRNLDYVSCEVTLSILGPFLCDYEAYMLHKLWQSLTDAVFGSLPSFIDAGEYVKKEVRGKVLSFWLRFADTQIVYPDLESLARYRRLHKEEYPPEIRDRLQHYRTLSDEELAKDFGLLRDDKAHFGYSQPFFITKDGVVDSATGCLIELGH